MSPELKKAVDRLERRALQQVITPRQRGILDALRDLGATKAADALETMLLTQENAQQDALETVKFLRAVE